jgi:hypothetical protein
MFEGIILILKRTHICCESWCRSLVTKECGVLVYIVCGQGGLNDTAYGLYSGRDRFEYIRNTVFIVILSPSSQLPIHHLKLNPDRCHTHSSQFIKSSWAVNRQGCKADLLPPLRSKVKNDGAITPLPHAS